MAHIGNPFIEHPIYLCCSSDELKPFVNYIYFIDGIAYATDSYVMLALSLTDIDADKSLIDCLNGYKMHRTDMQMMNAYERLIPEASGKISLNEEHTRILQLQPLDYADAENKYQTILEIFHKTQRELTTHKDSISKIKLGLYLLGKLSKAVGFLNYARFIFLKEPNRVFLEFDAYKNSFALVMPMIDDVS
jgi:hypothetical protein